MAVVPVTVSINVLMKGLDQVKGLQKMMNKLSTGASKTIGKNMSQMAVATKKGLGSVQQTNSELYESLIKNTQKIAYAQQTGIDTQKVMTNEILESNNAAMILKSRGVAGVDKAIRQTTASARGFKMEFLSIMFFGMFLQRVFGGLLKGMMNAFNKIDKKGVMPLSRSLTRLKAAWTFLQFSIVQASEGLLTGLITKAVELLDWFSALPEGWRQLIFVAAGFLALLGTIAFTVGTLKLAFGGIGTILAKLGIPATLSGSLTAISSLLVKLMIAIVILKSIWESNFGDIQEIVESLADNISIKFRNLFGTDLPNIVSGFGGLLKGILGGDLDEAGESFNTFAKGAIMAFVRIVLAVAAIMAGIVSFVSQGVAQLLLTFEELATRSGLAVAKAFGDQSKIKAFELEISGIKNRRKDVAGLSKDMFVGISSVLTNMESGAEALTNELFKSNKPITDMETKTSKVVGHWDLINQKIKESNETLKLSSQVGASFGELPIMMGKGFEANMPELEKKINTALEKASAYFPASAPKAGPFSNPTPFVRGQLLILQFSSGILEKAGLLKTVLTTVFEEAMQSAYNAFHFWIDAMVSEVNRMISAIRALQAVRAAGYGGGTSTVSIAQTVNVNGARDVESVRTAVKNELDKVAQSIKRQTGGRL